MELYTETELGKLYLGDAKDMEEVIELNSVDLIITDPPYPKEYFPCFEYLAESSPKILKSGGSLLTLLGHYELEAVMLLFYNKLKFRWLLHLSQLDGSHSRMAMGVEVTFKPILWYVKDKFPKERHYGFLRDGIKVSQSKEFHKWQQDMEWLEYYITKLTKENELVVDPFMGSGSLAIACEKLNRRWIGIEIEEETCEIIANRLLEVRE